jgi:hypothetical protein
MNFSSAVFALLIIFLVGATQSSTNPQIQQETGNPAGTSKLPTNLVKEDTSSNDEKTLTASSGNEDTPTAVPAKEDIHTVISDEGLEEYKASIKSLIKKKETFDALMTELPAKIRYR